MQKWAGQLGVAHPKLDEALVSKAGDRGTRPAVKILGRDVLSDSRIKQGRIGQWTSLEGPCFGRGDLTYPPFDIYFLFYVQDYFNLVVLWGQNIPSERLGAMPLPPPPPKVDPLDPPLEQSGPNPVYFGHMCNKTFPIQWYQTKGKTNLPIT